MNTIHWPVLTRRLHGRAIVDLWYDPAAGVVVILLEGGQEVLVSADWEGCQVPVGLQEQQIDRNAGRSRRKLSERDRARRWDVFDGNRGNH